MQTDANEGDQETLGGEIRRQKSLKTSDNTAANPSNVGSLGDEEKQRRPMALKQATEKKKRVVKVLEIENDLENDDEDFSPFLEQLITEGQLPFWKTYVFCCVCMSVH